MFDSLKIDYHLSYYRSSTDALASGNLDPKEFARLDCIRQASLLAIAFEVGIIDRIYGNLNYEDWQKAIAFIKKYEQANEVAA